MTKITEMTGQEIRKQAERLIRSKPLAGEELLRDALTIHIKLDDNKEIAEDLLYLGYLQNLQGKIKEAEGTLQESLIRSQTGDDIYQKARILQMQSRTFRRQGRMHQAEKKVREAMRINEKGEGIQYAKDLIVLTDILLDLDRIDGAEQSQSKADNLFKKDCGKPEYQAVSHMYLGWIRFKQHRYDEAEKVFNEALEVFEKEKSKKNSAESKRGLAEVDLDRNDLDGAEKKLKEARDLLKEEHDFEDGYKIDMVMAKLLDKKGEQGKAIDVLEEIIKKSSRQGYGFLVKRARDYLKSL